LSDTFPDLNAGFCDFRVDPFRPNRVWFTSCFAATHTGEGTIFGKPTGKRVECPPQTMSLSFNEDGQVTFYTGGYVMGEKPDIIFKMILSIKFKIPQKFTSPPPQTKL
jgi:hypothetical protein